MVTDSEEPPGQSKDPSSSRPPIALPEETRLREEYRVEEVLGTGSFGITYRCVDEHLDTSVAIKEYYPRQIAGRTGESSTIRPHSSEATEDFEYGLRQFMQEGRTVARFDHPNVVNVMSYFEENGTGYLVMDYYEGQTLSDYLAENGGRLPEEEAVGLMQDVLDGLRPVHAAGVLHRDIDPQNIYLTAEREAILIDFGAAREATGQRSQSLDVILKPGYAPIEQYSSSGNQGSHTDIYACAATLYKCLTGLKPPEATERIQTDELVPPAELNPDVSINTDLAVRKGLALKPELRIGSPHEFARLLSPDQTEQETTRTTQKPSVIETKQNSDLAGREGLTLQDPTIQKQDTADSESSLATSDGDSEGISSVRDSSNRKWSVIATAVGILGAVGLGVVFSDADLIQVLAFFATWVVVCGGLIGLFRQGERLMRPESRAAISDWLLGEDFAEKASRWPNTFADLFDAVFTENHLSWKCFRRSALVTVVVVLSLFCALVWLVASQVIYRTQVGPILLNFVWTIAELESGTYTLRIPGPTIVLSFLGSSLSIAAANIVIDYVSLFETRWIVGRMCHSNRTLQHLGYLVADLVATVLLALIPLYLLFLVEHPEYYQLAGLTGLFSAAKALLHSLFMETHIDIGYQYIMLITTLFTSVWVWLYVGTGLLLRGLWPLIGGLDWLKQIFDAEGRPAETMGFLLATVISIGFAVSAPFVL